MTIPKRIMRLIRSELNALLSSRDDWDYKDWWDELLKHHEPYDHQQSQEGTTRDEQPQTKAKLTIEECYSILEIPATTDLKVIKEAYLRRMAEYHPDKVSHLGRELQVFAAEKVKSINLAYQKLLKHLS